MCKWAARTPEDQAGFLVGGNTSRDEKEGYLGVGGSDMFAVGGNHEVQVGGTARFLVGGNT